MIFLCLFLRHKGTHSDLLHVKAAPNLEAIGLLCYEDQLYPLISLKNHAITPAGQDVKNVFLEWF